MKKILPRLRSILWVVALVGMTFTSVATAYIVFAPDTWPKPFYLVYRYPILAEAPVENASASGAEGATDAHASTSSGHAAPAVSAPAQAAVEPQTPHPSAPLEIRPGQGIMVDTGTKIVNLVDPTGRKYLRATIVLEFAPTDLTFYTIPEEERALFLESFQHEANVKLPVINDVIISLLASQTFESVYTAEGKEALRKTIMSTINHQLPEYNVIFVYFTEFVVQ